MTEHYKFMRLLVITISFTTCFVVGYIEYIGLQIAKEKTEEAKHIAEKAMFESMVTIRAYEAERERNSMMVPKVIHSLDKNN